MAAQVKKYDPNQYNFGNFAKTMNQNFAIERAQNGQGGAFGVNAGINAANPVNLGGTTNSQTLGNLGTFGTRDRYNNITGNFTGLLKRFNAGEQVIFGEPSSSPQQEPSLPPQQKPSLPPLQKPKEEIITEEKPTQEIITEEKPKQEIITYEKSLAGSQINAGEGAMDFETWQSAYSVDPVVEYQNAQAQLDYEFKTWMSDYGARAEQLYQMGLSNSGVSDIYGANAYTAYVQASMDLKRAQIQQQKENRQMYQKYVDEYEAAKAAKTEAANAKIATAFNSYAGSYTPDQEQSVRIALAAQGLDITAIESVIGQLNAYYQSLPEGSRPDALANEANVTAALNWLNTNYTSDMTDEELSAMLGATYGADVVQKALEKFAPFKAVIDRLAGDEAAKNAFSAMLEMVSAGDTDVESLKSKAKGLGYSEDAIAKAAENILPFVKSAGETVNPQIVEVYTSLLSTYTKEQESNIRALYKNLGWSDQDVDELINMLNSSIDANSQTIVDETVGTLEATADVTPETIVMSTLVNDLKGYKTQLAAGKITQEQYDQYASSFSNSAVKAYEWAVKSVDNMANAYSMFGFDEAEWSEMDDAQRESAIMDEMAEYRTEGLISESSYSSLVNDWVVSEIEAYKGNDSNDYLESVGSVVYDLTTFPLSSDARSEMIDSIIKEIGFDMEQLTLSWNVNGKIKKAGVSLKSSNKEATNVRGALLKAGYYSPYGTERYSVYNGVIYVSYDDAGQTWYEVSENNIKFTGVSGITGSDREGVYAMVARVIETKLQRPDDTRR